MLNKRIPRAAVLLLLATAFPARSQPIEVPLHIDYDFIRKILVAELYTGPENTAKVWEDGHGCGFLTLADPQLSGEKGMVRIVNRMQTRVGARLGGQCIALLNWKGSLETFQQPTLDAKKAVVTLPVVKMNAYDPSGRPFGNDKLWETVRHYVEPKLAGVKLDLQDAKEKIRKTVASVVPEENAAQVRKSVDSLALNKISAGEKGIDLAFSLDMPDLKHVNAQLKQPSAPLSAAEMQQWQQNWQHWETFLTDAVKQATADTQSQPLRADLQAILADAQAAFEQALSSDMPSGEDPVRRFFTRSWPRLAPILTEISKDLPGTKSLHYATFIAATDVLYELDNRGALLGLDISSDGLRKVARLMIAEKAKN
ncbi:MAG: hypothetical protein ACU837_12120 [Gammaproteobacteria bacterium]